MENGDVLLSQWSAEEEIDTDIENFRTHQTNKANKAKNQNPSSSSRKSPTQDLQQQKNEDFVPSTPPKLTHAHNHNPERSPFSESMKMSSMDSSLNDFNYSKRYTKEASRILSDKVPFSPEKSLKPEKKGNSLNNSLRASDFENVNDTQQFDKKSESRSMDFAETKKEVDPISAFMELTQSAIKEKLENLKLKGQQQMREVARIERTLQKFHEAKQSLEQEEGFKSTDEPQLERDDNTQKMLETLEKTLEKSFKLLEQHKTKMSASTTSNRQFSSSMQKSIDEQKPLSKSQVSDEGVPNPTLPLVSCPPSKVSLINSYENKRFQFKSLDEKRPGSANKNMDPSELEEESKSSALPAAAERYKLNSNGLNSRQKNDLSEGPKKKDSQSNKILYEKQQEEQENDLKDKPNSRLSTPSSPTTEATSITSVPSERNAISPKLFDLYPQARPPTLSDNTHCCINVPEDNGCHSRTESESSQVDVEPSDDFYKRRKYSYEDEEGGEDDEITMEARAIIRETNNIIEENRTSLTYVLLIFKKLRAAFKDQKRRRQLYDFLHDMKNFAPFEPIAEEGSDTKEDISIHKQNSSTSLNNKNTSQSNNSTPSKPVKKRNAAKENTTKSETEKKKAPSKMNENKKKVNKKEEENQAEGTSEDTMSESSQFNTTSESSEVSSNSNRNENLLAAGHEFDQNNELKLLEQENATSILQLRHLEDDEDEIDNENVEYENENENEDNENIEQDMQSKQNAEKRAIRKQNAYSPIKNETLKELNLKLIQLIDAKYEKMGLTSFTEESLADSCNEIVDLIKASFGNVSNDLLDNIQESIFKYRDLDVNSHKEDLVKDICDILYDEVFHNVVISYIQEAYDKDIVLLKSKINELEKQKHRDVKKLKEKRGYTMKGDLYPRKTFDDEIGEEDPLEVAEQVVRSKLSQSKRVAAQNEKKEQNEKKKDKADEPEDEENEETGDDDEEEEEENEEEDMEEEDEEDGEGEDGECDEVDHEQDANDENEENEEEEENENEKEILTIEDLPVPKKKIATNVDIKKRMEEEEQQMDQDFIGFLPSKRQEIEEQMDNNLNPPTK